MSHFLKISFYEHFFLPYIHCLRKFYFTSNLVLWKESEKEPKRRKEKKRIKNTNIEQLWGHVGWFGTDINDLVLF